MQLPLPDSAGLSLHPFITFYLARFKDISNDI